MSNFPEDRIYTPNELASAVAHRKSLVGVARCLGLKDSPRVKKALMEDIRRLGLSTEHFEELPRSNSGLTQLFWSYALQAKRRGIKFTLTKKEVARIVVNRCHYCGKLPSNVHRTQGNEFRYNGIDRVHNDRGYSWEENVLLACCRNCNVAKRSLTPLQLARIAEAFTLTRTPYPRPRSMRERI